MLKSMTGFGRGEAYGQGRKFVIELKAVNHRYLEVVVRLPRMLVSLEDRVRKLIQSQVARGRIDVFFSMEQVAEKNAAVKVDKALGASYYKAMRDLQEYLQLDGEIRVLDIAQLPEVLTLEEPEEDIEAWWPVVQEAVASGLENLVQMRLVEGEQLKKDLIKRIEKIDRMREQIRNRAPMVVEDYRARLNRQLEELLGDSIPDPIRVAGEIAIFAERSNITEEIVRLGSHLKQVKNCLTEDEPVGRKLDFLVQEMNREINTIASKANDSEISSIVVNLKSELEKIREQIQNLE
ncbi:YicC/YloC family endoribonuclease [Desulfolucanica intricata]|uniref:YicC/YloC family endoribonuclease n=1 Tax=Desulfolucanica intricata TaxID=1285191 RepID=UPI00082EDC0D|nr:YicC/YloC family endoribonuclease [Desulfolucanica intricata]